MNIITEVKKCPICGKLIDDIKKEEIITICQACGETLVKTDSGVFVEYTD